MFDYIWYRYHRIESVIIKALIVQTCLPFEYQPKPSHAYEVEDVTQKVVGLEFRHFSNVLTHGVQWKLALK